MTAATPDSITAAAALLAAGLPFAAFVLIMVLLRGRPRLCARLSIAAITVSLLCALLLLVRHWHMTVPVSAAADWLVSGRVTVSIGFLLDPTSLLMLTIVTAISFLVQVYSLGYMAGDPGFARYYGFMSLFAWAMISLVISPTMLQLYVFWELVGVSSYLLIGFWYEKFSASEAGKKAFVMTRTGDVAFFLGLLLVLMHFGNLDILKMNAGDVPLHMPPAMITLSALLIFGGIVGKSAQFPLLTWLPDAMEGPTPVSALLHSATMVAECSSALTGVGPSMASGSQVRSGNWALLPTMPPKINRAERVIMAGGMCRGTSPAFILRMSRLPKCINTSSSPRKKATSPVRVITKAFLPASLAENFSYQKPMSR